jgi:hypothetical protein
MMLDIETVPQYPLIKIYLTAWQSLWNDKNSKTMPENFIA